MKVFYVLALLAASAVLALFAASAVLAQIELPMGVSKDGLLKQSCIDPEKSKASAAKAPAGECADAVNYDATFENLVKGFPCFLKANSVRDEKSGIKIEVLKKAVLSVATSQEKGNAFNAIIDGCNKEKLAIVPTIQQLGLLFCVMTTVQEKGICKP